MIAVDSLMAVLFVADSPVPMPQLAQTLGLTEGQIEEALGILERRLEESGPIQLVHLAGGIQLSTKPQYGELIANFLKPQRQRLGRSLMEVLAIIAYRQPLTIAEIEAVRGVQSDHSVRSLLERRLVQDVGRKPVPGRPVLYGTTAEFLHQFKLEDLSQLPPIELEILALPAPDEDDAASDVRANSLPLEGWPNREVLAERTAEAADFEVDGNGELRDPR